VRPNVPERCNSPLEGERQPNDSRDPGLPDIGVAIALQLFHAPAWRDWVFAKVFKRIANFFLQTYIEPVKGSLESGEPTKTFDAEHAYLSLSNRS